MDVAAGEVAGLRRRCMPLVRGVVRLASGRPSRRPVSGTTSMMHLERHFARLAGRDGLGCRRQASPSGWRSHRPRLRPSVHRAAASNSARCRAAGPAKRLPSPCARRARRACRHCARPARMSSGISNGRVIGQPSAFLAPASSSRAQRFAVGLSSAGLLGGAEADGGLAGDQRWAVGRLRAARCAAAMAFWVVAVDAIGIPATALKRCDLVDAVGQATADRRWKCRCRRQRTISWLTA